MKNSMLSNEMSQQELAIQKCIIIVYHLVYYDVYSDFSDKMQRKSNHSLSSSLKRVKM